MKVKGLVARIPGKLNNTTMVGFLDRLRRAENAIPRNFSANDKLNAEVYAKRKETGEGFTNGLIERQADLTDMSLGRSTLDYSGCEVIAVYNLLYRYSNGDFSVSLPALIEIFEHDGIIRAGRFGVSPKSMADYLKGIGIPINFTTDETDFDVLGFYCDHFILTVMNDREDIFKQIHTFYISKEKDNFISHNGGLRMRYHSISEVIGALPNGRARGISLIALREPEKED